MFDKLRQFSGNDDGKIRTLHYYKDGTPAKEAGRAALLIDADAFHVYAYFEDSDIYNTATKNNERTWQTGDALEFFVQSSVHKDYYEFHLTPNNITLQLHLPPVEKKGTIPFEEQIFESGIKTSVKVCPEENYWQGEIIVPFAGLNMTKEMVTGSRFAICRYNYSHSWQDPDISSTALFPDSGFHNPARWHEIK